MLGSAPGPLSPDLSASSQNVLTLAYIDAVVDPHVFTGAHAYQWHPVAMKTISEQTTTLW